jgi:hypothetical protein
LLDNYDYALNYKKWIKVWRKNENTLLDNSFAANAMLLMAAK